WITNSCQQVPDSNENIIEYWSKGSYEFTTSNEIIFGNTTYSDSNCISEISSQTSNVDGFGVAYQDLGEAVLQEGINGRGVSIEMGADANRITVSGYYTIINNTLCLSDAFTLEPLTFNVSPEGSKSIDFANCLGRSR
ncbi:MAG: hypothetical protein HUJ29_02165, partial [Gammaproteobacteria bacterium]|nr:hypothetical protein [Gammaproteobacteria bacterium]